jgi:DNA-binding IclR family transcriptional regulator
MAQRPDTPVPSVSYAVAMLRLLGRNGEAMGVTAIARAMGIGPSSAFNLARTLVAEGLLDVDDRTKAYRIGAGGIDLARMALRGDALAARARQPMEALADRIDAAIGLWREQANGRLLLVALAESEAATRIHMVVGQRQPAGAGSTGRALLAAQGADEASQRAAFAATRWRGRIDADSYVAQVAAARRLGYAVDNQWLNPGIVTVAAVVPDADGQPRYCLSASLFAGQHDARALAAIGQELVAEAQRLGHD